MSEALRLSGVAKTYGEGRAAVEVLKGVDLSVGAGEIVALVAPSGAGKSTLLHIAGLLDTADEGAIHVAGRDVGGLDDGGRTAARRAEIGFVYQFHHLLPEFSAAENVILPQLAAGVSRRDADARAEELLASVGLQNRAQHRPAELSGGEQQRVAICRALVNRPRLLLADEPTGNLDVETAEIVFELLLQLTRNEGLGALIATHNPDLAARMDRTVRLEAGAIAG
ncbi:MAG: ABC transporter ATP-binding protein [Pseudomonadota bacterium]